MPVSTTDAQNWASPGAKDSMAKTYAAVKVALENNENIKRHNIDIFLQGSYANATNIRGDADVDVVVMLRSSWIADTSRLPLLQKLAYDNDHSSATYGAKELRADALAALVGRFGSDKVNAKNKCIRVDKSDGYVDADVVPAIQHRIYTSYDSTTKGQYIEGVKIFTQKGPVIINYPKVHIANGEAKNIATSSNYKPAVRQLKQLKRRAVQSGRVDPSHAPGYLLECMTYNAPNEVFSDDHHTRLTALLGWLLSVDFSKFTSVDGIHDLFVTDPGNFSAVTAKTVTRALAEEMVS